MLRIKHIIEEGKELDVIRDLFREYEKELDEDICFQSFEEELNNPLKKYGPPSGDLILAYWEDEIAGCIALTGMKEPGACEMKRLYVKPSFRKNKIGRLLVEELLNSAKERKYEKMRLDTFLNCRQLFICISNSVLRIFQHTIITHFPVLYIWKNNCEPQDLFYFFRKEITSFENSFVLLAPP